MNRAERSSAELAQDIAHEAQDLVRLELQLAQRELTGMLVRNAIAFGAFAFAGAVLLAAVVALPAFVLAAWGLQAGLICLGIYAVLAVVALITGRLVLRLEPPRRTLASLEETKRWALRQIRSNGR